MMLLGLRGRNYASRRACRVMTRHCSSHTASPSFVPSQPPLLIRSALVGGTTALMTPLFPVIGVNQLLYRFTDHQTRMMITGGSSMLYFSAMTLAPNAFYYAPLLLPFAVGNGVTAASIYIASDLMAGGPQQLANLRMLGVPVAGPGIGLTTALVAPFTFPLAWWMVWGGMPFHDAISGETLSFVKALTMNEVMLPCLATTGLVSGSLLHFALKPMMVGVKGWPWQKLAGAMTAAITVGLVALYSTSLRTDVPHLSALRLGGERWGYFHQLQPCYVSSDELDWIPSLNHSTGQVCSMLTKTGAQHAGQDDALQALALRKKAIALGEAVFLSKNEAYFAGIKWWSPSESGPNWLLPDELRARHQELPIGETLVTDALVVMVAGKVAQSMVHDHLDTLLPWLNQSSLTEKLQNQRKWFQESWVTARSSSQALWADLKLRKSQMRELLRLENGADPGPVSVAVLVSELEQAGVQLGRARDAIEKLGWENGNREEDWRMIHGNVQVVQRQDQKRMAMMGLAALTTAGAAVCALSNLQ